MLVPLVDDARLTERGRNRKSAIMQENHATSYKVQRAWATARETREDNARNGTVLGTTPRDLALRVRRRDWTRLAANGEHARRLSVPDGEEPKGRGYTILTRKKNLELYTGGNWSKFLMFPPIERNTSKWNKILSRWIYSFPRIKK